VLSFAMIHNKPRATRITIAARMNNQVPVPRVLWFARTITEQGWHEAWPAMCKEVQRQVKNCKAVGVFPLGSRSLQLPYASPEGDDFVSLESPDQQREHPP
jgi:hypothetical protein